MNKYKGPASGQQWLAMRKRLSEPTTAEQEEQEYLSEVIEIEMDPEDERPRKKSPN
tara:strand:- start:956 stop:1123 length:168 start_codon:yes stop_codon:yes gene_type:complete